MIKIIMTCIFFICFFYLSVAQDISINIKDYYNRINEAELLICEENFKEAEMIYDEQLSIDSSSLFLIDMYNYYVLLCILKDELKAKKIANHLIINGFWTEKIRTLFLDAFNNRLDIVPKKTKDQRLELLLFFDQQVRQYCRGYEEHCVKTVQFVDSMNLNLLNSYYEKEWIKDVIVEGSTPVEWYVIIHNTQWQRYDLDSLMLQAVYGGRFHNSLYIDIIDGQKNNNSTKKDIYRSAIWWKVNGKNYIELPDKENIALINEERKKVFYQSVEHQVEKIKFMVANPEMPFRFGYFGATAINDMPEEMVKSITENMLHLSIK